QAAEPERGSGRAGPEGAGRRDPRGRHGRDRPRPRRTRVPPDGARRGLVLRHNPRMRISSKADYAVRATAELAAVEGKGPVTAERLSKAQDIPLTFLLKILSELRHA